MYNFAKEEKSENTLAMSVNSTLEKFRKVFIAILVAFIVAVIIVIVGIVVRSNSVKSGIEEIDTITFTLLNRTSEIAGDDLKQIQDSAIEKLSSISKKSGIVGVRASMLLADLYFQQDRFDESKNAWLRAANLEKDSYTSAFSTFNAAVCAEKLNDIDSAIALYRKCSEDSTFLLSDHAFFSLGRVCEMKGDFSGANEAYQKLNDIHPDSNWAKMSKSRMISNKISENH